MLNIYATFETGQNYYSYLKRISDGLYYDTNDATFKAFASLVDGKIDFIENSDVDGEYSWSLSIPDGEYVVYTKKTSDDSNAAQAQIVTLKFGNEVNTAQIIDDNTGYIEIEIEEC